MADERVEDQMIEIGDPTDESAAVEPPARLVIEYRERGVPWMLIPPMIVLSAVASVMVYHKLAPPRQVTITVPAPSIAAEPAVATGSPASPSPTPPGPSTAVESSPGPAAPFELAMGSPSTLPPGQADVPPAAVATEIPLEPAPFPRVQGLGFDPRGLVEPEPPVDPAVAPVAGPQDRVDQPARDAAPAVDPGPREQPEEVDPNVLPVDPREARRRRDQRIVEARQKAEADRGRFHAELRAICRKSGERAGPEIDALCKKYGMDVDPAIKTQAARKLEVSAAGAGLAVRINLLRTMGFSEPLILSDIFENQGRWDSKATRGGPRSKDEVLYQAARLLLGFPPSRVASPVRSVSTNRAAR